MKSNKKSGFALAEMAMSVAVLVVLAGFSVQMFAVSYTHLYSSLLASMLRSLDVPTKLVTGYVAPDYLYHAWNEVYIEGTGWVRINRFYSTYKAVSYTHLLSTTVTSG